MERKRLPGRERKVQRSEARRAAAGERLEQAAGRRRGFGNKTNRLGGPLVAPPRSARFLDGCDRKLSQRRRTHGQRLLFYHPRYGQTFLPSVN